MVTVCDELSRKLCNTRIQEILSATKQDLAAKKGLASTVGINLRTTLLTQHTKLSTIRHEQKLFLCIVRKSANVTIVNPVLQYMSK